VSKARLVITAVRLEKRPVAEVIAAYGVSRAWLYKLLTRYDAEGEAAFEPRSKRPRSSPSATPQPVVDRVLALRAQLTGQGLDAGPHTIAWHLTQEGITVSTATISRILTRHGAVVRQPGKRPKSSYRRFQADLPNQVWQSDFTHWQLADGSPGGTDVEILNWLDDHSRYLLGCTVHRPVTGPVVLAQFRAVVAAHGLPASVLTDNGLVYTTRFAGGRRGRATRNGFETELAAPASGRARPSNSGSWTTPTYRSTVLPLELPHERWPRWGRRLTGSRRDLVRGVREAGA
jgi:transposase